MDRLCVDVRNTVVVDCGCLPCPDRSLCAAFTSICLNANLRVRPGIGTGWSFSIPNYNPRDLISNLRLMLRGEAPVAMTPWWLLSAIFIPMLRDHNRRSPGPRANESVPRYDYVYQLNWPGPRVYSPATEVQEGNTGFYYASIRKVKLLSVLWDAVLKECRLKPNLDGQPNFWSALRRLRKSLAPPCFRICRGDAGQDGQCNVTAEEEILDYCEMDPFEHRTGWGHRDDKGPVSYHANFKVGRKPKIAALTGMGVWQPTCT